MSEKKVGKPESAPKAPRKPRTVRPAWSLDQWKDFITKWQAAADFASVVQATGLTVEEVRSRAATARKNGVVLKEHRGKVAWGELIKLGDPV